MNDDRANSFVALMKKFLALQIGDWLVIGYACFLTPVVWVSLRLSGLPRTLAWAKVARLNAQIDGSRAPIPASIGRFVNIAARYGPIRAACLVRSIVLILILSACGVRGTLRIGVRKGVSSQLDAHAWVECEGIPVNDHPNVATNYSAFDALDKPVVGELP